uniref:NRR repressor homolog 1 n=1 Tax=Arundo donax TaxID=35708 RepID=A0A0A9BKP9_ARUDO
MEATEAGEEKPPRPTGDAASSQASPLVAAGPGVVADASSGGGAAAVESGAEDDDEEVERFYALLDNIRALRGMYRAGAVAGAVIERGGSAGAAGRGRKRAREADEPPWMPAFRMEDFEEVVVVEAKKRSRDGIARKGTSDAAAGDEEEGEVVEPRGRSGRRVAASG